MHNRFSSRWFAIVSALLFVHVVHASEKQAVKLKEATEVMEDIMAIPENAIPPSLLADAQAIAIVPGVLKAGFIIGGRWGDGVVLRRDKARRAWSDPVFLNLAGGSFGLQVGAQATDVILVFKNRRGLDSLVNGKFTLGADAAVAAGPVGRNAAAATDVQLRSEILSYSRSRGLFAGVSLDGSVMEIDHNANAAYYGKRGITPTEIFENRAPRHPPEAVKLKTTVARYAGR
jgi:lipid-binding SYLF domain-containing protein